MNSLELVARFGRQLTPLGTDPGSATSCYVRGRSEGYGWTYVLVPLSTGVPAPAPIYLQGAPAGTGAGPSHGSVTAVIDAVALQAGTLDATFEVKLTTAGLALGKAEWELVLSPDRPVVPDGTADPSRLAIISFAAGGSEAEPSKTTRVRVQTATEADGLNSVVTAEIDTTPSRPVTGQTVEGPVHQTSGYFGTSAGASQPVDVIYTVDTTKPVTGTMLELDTAAGSAKSRLGLVVDSSWTPSTRVVASTTSVKGDSRLFRYLLAMVRMDGSESPVGPGSMAVDAPIGTVVTLTAPDAPELKRAPHGQGVPDKRFKEWRLYRTRRKQGSWQTPVQVGTVAAGGKTTDQPPKTDPENGQIPEGAAFSLKWGAPDAAALMPDPLTLTLKVMSLDEELPTIEKITSWETNRLTLTGLTLGASGSAQLDSGRAGHRPGSFTLHSLQDTPLDVAFQELSSSTSVSVKSFIPAGPANSPVVSAQWSTTLDTFAYLAWKCSHPVSAKGSVVIPPSKVDLRHVALDIPKATTLVLRSQENKADRMTRMNVGWQSDARGSLEFRLGIAPKEGSSSPPTAVDVVARGVPTDLGLELLLPPSGATDAAVEIDAGRYESPPPPGEPPAGAPRVAGVPLDPVEQLLVHSAVAPDPATPLMAAGPGKAVAVDLRTPDCEPADLRVRVDGLKRFKLVKQAGAGTDVTTLVELAEPLPFRMQMVSSTVPRGPDGECLPVPPEWTVLHLRARQLERFDAKVQVGLGKGDETPQSHSDFAMAVHVESKPVGALRARLETGGSPPDAARPASTQTPVEGKDLSVVDIQVDRVPPGAKVELYPAAASGSGAAGSNGAMRISGNLSDEPTRVLARIWGKGPTAKPMIDIDTVVRGPLNAVIGGEAGTYTDASGGTGPGQAKIVDAGSPFHAALTGRRVRWAGGAGRITAVTPDTLTVTVAEGSAPDPRLAATAGRGTARRAWYQIGGASDAVGMRAKAEHPVRLRVGAQLKPGALLRGVPPSPRLHMEQPDDLATLDGPGTQSVTARANGLRSLVLGSWEVQMELPQVEPERLHFPLPPLALVDLDGTALPGTDGEFKRLLGPASPTDPRLVLARADTPRWTRFAAELDASRPNRSLLVMIHHASPPAATTHKVRDRVAQQIRVPEVPGAFGLQLGPSVIEITSAASWGPAFVRMEPSLWLRGAAATEAGFGSVHLKEVPPLVILAGGTRHPDLHGNMNAFAPDEKRTLGTVTVPNWKRSVQRIVAGGGNLVIGRFRTVSPDGPWQADKNAPWPDPGASEMKWAYSDIRRLEIFPASTDPNAPGELLIHSPGQQQAHDGADAGFQADVNGGRCTAHIFKVDMGHRPQLPGRRAAPEADSWIDRILTEIQMEDIEGRFAFGLSVGYYYDPVNPLQDDETTAGHWWAVAYKALLTNTPDVQFGNGAGTFVVRNAPWNPYWA